ncbi:hypothetical protein ACOSP7_010741 [Xanthoceras sorbifolium]
MASCTKPLLGSFFPTPAEGLAIVCGLQLARDSGLCPAVVELDASTLVELDASTLVNSKNFPLNEFGLT